ncbi:U-box domain-containing protein 31 [Hibiscus syriacus]|uniref:RING-type E3 ubiquitin transferase n=1 Tax=Hibiscus syriacus TaxID=106335 RepID=A0A6A2ZX47_HIBSY|nr:U-box domain-containing protein 31 [Hibiscus syriacus]
MPIYQPSSRREVDSQVLDLETAVKDGVLGGGGGVISTAFTSEKLDLKMMIEEFESMDVPNVFICPISLEPMHDPVTLCTGQTYERSNILKWFSLGHYSCPTTMQELWDESVTPNKTLQQLIYSWFSQEYLATNKRSEGVVGRVKEILENLKKIKGSIATKINCTRLIGMLMEGTDFASGNIASLSLLVGLLRVVKDKKHPNGVLAGLSLLMTMWSHESVKNSFVNVGAVPHTPEGRLALKDCPNVIPNIVKLLMKASENCTQLASSILWAICKFAPEECASLAVDAGLAAKLLLVIQSGCDPVLKHVKSKRKRSKRSQIRVGAMAADEGKVKIEKFDGADFGFWKMQIEDFLYQKNLYQPLSGKQPEGMKNEDWALLDRQALGVIRLTLSRNVAFNIAKEKTTVGLMAALSSMYEKPSTSNKVHLMRRLFNLRMAKGASVAQHLNKLNTITTQLSSMEIEFDDEVRALILLSSLPDSWNATVTAVNSSSGNSKLKFDDVRDLVLSEEIRRREAGEASTSSALHTESRGRTSERNSNRGRSKSRRGKSRTCNKGFTCYNCGKKGHFKRDCRASKKNTGAQESANMTEETGDAMILSVNSPIESWILDSGASFHSTPCREIMENYVSGDFGKVHLANDETLKILDGEGYSTTFSGCEWKITKGALVIARGKKTGTLYVTSNLENIIAVAYADGKSNLWHQRLGHMSEKGMKTLLSKGKVPDLKNVDVGLCEDCIFGKQKKVSFTKIGKTPKVERLELVHTDVSGPSPVPSLAGSLYYVTFIYDSTRKVWVYFLKKKSEVFDTFRKWKAMVENETGLKVKRLRSDNGGEYRDSRFRDFCANNGIKMETTVPITPQQNGVAECMNRTLNERARSMRIHAGLPKFLWTEAINTAAYLINRGPSVPLDGGIPEEAWRKKEINLSHLRVFGCISYVHINSAERSKLDAKSNKCVFVGYGGDEFGYRFWDYENRKIIRSRDVIFNENVMYKDMSTAESSNTEAETKEFAEFEEISGNDVQISPEAVQEEEPGTPELRRSSRIPKPTQRYSPSLHYLLPTDNGEPECYDEAMQVDNSIKWESSMKDEMDSLMSNQTWELVELPPGKKALHNKWIYRIKEEHDGSKRYKARLVVKGFQQKEGIDYNEIFSPVVKLSTIKLVLKIVAAENLHLEQLDVKTAFLHGDLEEEIYMRQLEGFIKAGKKNLVCRLKKSLYGLKQAPRQWYKKFDSFMGSSGFTRCQADHCCYIKRFDNSFIILLLYVDDMLVAGSNMQEIIHLKQKLSKQFAMKDLGAAKQILGMRIKRDIKSGTLMLSQAKYINKVLSRFNIQDAKPVSTPLGVHFRLSKDQSPKTEEERAHMVKVPYASTIGSLMYAMVCTRPDIAHAVGAVSRYMNNPGKVHWEAVKWILRYLRGTTNKALCFKGGDTILTGYVDADLAGNVDIRRSTTGYVYTLGGTAVSWVSQLQKIVALSTTEAEYVAVTEASKEMVWFQSFLEELGKKQENIVLYCDSQSAIHLAKNPSFHSRTKHIQLRYHFIRSLLEDGILKLEKISRAQNPADMLTKAVTTDKLKLCSTSVGMLE